MRRPGGDAALAAGRERRARRAGQPQRAEICIGRPDQGADSLNQADRASQKSKNQIRVDYLAYLAQQRAAIPWVAITRRKRERLPSGCRGARTRHWSPCTISVSCPKMGAGEGPSLLRMVRGRKERLVPFQTDFRWSSDFALLRLWPGPDPTRRKNGPFGVRAESAARDRLEP